jgi:hypothetical protein
LLYLGLLPVRFISRLVVSPSISKPLSSQPAYRQRNQYPDGHLLLRSRAINRSLTPLLYSLSLPPVSTIVRLRLAIWYAPRLLLGSLSISLLVYLFHVVHCAIMPSSSTEPLQLCYNIMYMTAGGLEPPRQLPASSFQSYRACLLHHAVSESGEGGLAKDCPSPKLPLLLIILLKWVLSKGKSTHIGLKMGNKSNQQGVA